ncbi:MAG: hypothetical protein JWL59_2595 [Chthoniobacteraceae bacterium]|nr:hypothetical protein [Chthoniobacteraceae bacterium]
MSFQNETPAQAGTPENKDLKVSLVAGRWIVEDENGASIADAENQAAAVDLARQAGADTGASQIAVHAADGSLEATFPIVRG